LQAFIKTLKLYLACVSNCDRDDKNVKTKLLQYSHISFKNPWYTFVIINLTKGFFMKNRRDFMKSTLAVSAVALTATTIPLFAKQNTKANIFAYSKANPGRWEGKDKSHAPVVSISGKKVTIETKHGMHPAHYIVKHTLVSETGDVVGERVFFPETDKKALSHFELKGEYKELYALSFCNLHDQWVTKVSL
jgi:superoxide reductase